MTRSKGLLLVISGPSGTGKGTICAQYAARNNCFISISATTRPPREGEIDGVNYYFLTEEEFRSRIKNDGFLEWACFCENYYGTPKDAVEQKLSEGIDVILEIEVQGAMKVRSHYPEGVFIFVVPPSLLELKKRLEGRHTESLEQIEKRLEIAKHEIKYVDKYNYILYNDTVENAVRRLEAIVEAEKCRMERNIDSFREVFK